LVISKITISTPSEKEIKVALHSRGACSGGDPRLLAFKRKLANQADAIDQCIKNSVSPAAGDEGSGLLVHRLVRLGEKAQPLPGRRRGKFLNGDAKWDVAAGLALHERKKVQLGKLLCRIFLRKLPIAHPSDPQVG